VEEAVKVTEQEQEREQEQEMEDEKTEDEDKEELEMEEGRTLQKPRCTVARAPRMMRPLPRVLKEMQRLPRAAEGSSRI